MRGAEWISGQIVLRSGVRVKLDAIMARLYYARLPGGAAAIDLTTWECHTSQPRHARRVSNESRVQSLKGSGKPYESGSDFKTPTLARRKPDMSQLKRTHVPTILLRLGLCLIASGCIEKQETDDDTVQQEVSPEPTASSATSTTVPTESPTPTAVPTPVATLTPAPTPALSEAIITDDFLFEPSSVPGCKLPCWQGLEVGISGREEIQRMYDTIFAFNGTRQFIPDNLPTPMSDSPSDPLVLPIDYYAAGNGWFIEPSGTTDYPQSFTVNTIYERDTFTLRAIEFSSSYSAFNVNLTPYRVIRELGEPSQIVMTLSPTERGDVLRFEMRMMYDESGMVFYFGEQFLPASLAVFPDHSEGSVTLCLDDTTWNNNYLRYRQVLILDPLEDGFNGLNPLQEFLLPFATGKGLTLLTDFFDISLEEIEEMAVQNSTTCLFTTFYETYSPAEHTD